MNLLALDTATSACSVALLVGDSVVASRSEEMERGHAEVLVPMIAAVMRDARASLPQGFQGLDVVAVTVGPGAFTGVRIGLATARAIAAAAGIPVIGLTTLETVAAGQEAEGRPLLVSLNSKRADVYAQLFDAAHAGALAEPRAIDPAEIPDLLPAGTVALAGDGSTPVEAALTAAGRPHVRLEGHGRPEATVLARIAAERLERAGPPRANGRALVPRPLYLRPPDVTLPKRRQ